MRISSLGTSTKSRVVHSLDLASIQIRRQHHLCNRIHEVSKVRQVDERSIIALKSKPLPGWSIIFFSWTASNSLKSSSMLLNASLIDTSRFVLDSFFKAFNLVFKWTRSTIRFSTGPNRVHIVGKVLLPQATSSQSWLGSCSENSATWSGVSSYRRQSIPSSLCPRFTDPFVCGEYATVHTNPFTAPDNEANSLPLSAIKTVSARSNLQRITPREPIQLRNPPM